jgi:hypothetical protein
MDKWVNDKLEKRSIVLQSLIEETEALFYLHHYEAS